MKHFSIILIIALIIISCKLFDDENGDTKYDYKVGHTFELMENSSIVLNDSINNKYYTLWFKSVIDDNRMLYTECDTTSDFNSIGKAMVILKIMDENSDTTDVELEILGCLEYGSKEQEISIGSNKLVFTVEQLIPYPDNQLNTDNDYTVTLTIANEHLIKTIQGGYQGSYEYGDINTDVRFVFDDTSYIGISDTPNQPPIGKGAFHQAKGELIFNNMSLWSKYIDKNIILNGIYQYAIGNNKLDIWKQGTSGKHQFGLQSVENIYFDEKELIKEKFIGCEWVEYRNLDALWSHQTFVFRMRDSLDIIIGDYKYTMLYKIFDNDSIRIMFPGYGLQYSSSHEFNFFGPDTLEILQGFIRDDIWYNRNAYLNRRKIIQ